MESQINSNQDDILELGLEPHTLQEDITTS